MKEIPCPTCRQAVEGKNGKPLTIGNFTSGNHPWVVKCFRCMGSFKLYAGDLAKLPKVSVLK